VEQPFFGKKMEKKIQGNMFFDVRLLCIPSRKFSFGLRKPYA
jgi:hypothetical protein